MPDLVAHLASGYVAAIPFWRRETVRVLFLAGVVLPDVMSRPIQILFPRAHWIVAPLQTPFALAVAYWLLAQMFADARLRITAFWALAAGGMLHLALDVLQSHLGEGYWWLFPFSMHELDIGLFRPEDSLTLLPLTAGIIIGVELVMRLKRRPAAGAARLDNRG